MQLFEEMSEQDINTISMQCESFFLTVHKTVKLQDVHNLLIATYGEKYHKAAWMVITAASKAVRSGVLGVQIPFARDTYTTANRKTGNLKLSYNTCRDLLYLMDNDGYIEIYKGVPPLGGKTGVKSCTIINDKLRNLMQGGVTSKASLKKESLEFIEIRNSDTKKPIASLVGFDGVREKRNLVARYNEALMDTSITIDDLRCSVQYKRIYADSLKGGGRWYSFNTFQTVGAGRRKDIRIDGNPTTEVDYKAIQPSMLYTMEGVDKGDNFEPYAVGSGIVSGGDVRSFIKLAMLILMFAKSRRCAVNSLKRKVAAGNFPGVVLGEGGYKALFDALYENNKEISHHFDNPDLWKMLQWYDSRLVEYVIMKFLDRGLPICPYHDSFVVPVDNRQLLINTMQEAWVEVFGTSMNCRWDVEF